MHDKPVFLTPEGRAKLEAELKHLRDDRRPEVAERIKAAKDFSDTTDNAEFEEAKNEQAFVEGRILTIERMLANSVMIDAERAGATHDMVRIGSKVTVIDDENETAVYSIVGSAEASPRQGRISNESPVGQALLGRKVGDSVEVVVPVGTLRYRITDIN
jgi:transcription elongation factor GreA